MSSFFLKNKNAGTKRKAKSGPIKNAKHTKKAETKPTTKKEEEEISSDDEDIDGTNAGYSSDEEQETAQDKRLRLAKKYLEEIQRQEKERADDKNLHKNVTDRLNKEYLDTVGKLKHKVAENVEQAGAIRTVKHKLQKLSITCLCLSACEKFLFVGSKTGIIVKWKYDTFECLGTMNCAVNGALEPPPKRAQIIAMALSTDGNFLAVADTSNLIQIWCPNKLKWLHSFKGHRDTVTSLAFRKESHELYSASKDRSVKIWSMDDMAYIESLFGHQAGITGIDALTRERAITAGGIDCSIRIWKIAEESQLIYQGHSGSIEDVKLISEENFLSSGNDGSICLWSSMKKKPLSVQKLAHGSDPVTGEANWITAIATYLNTDIIASGSSDGFIKVWKLGDNFRNITPLLEIPVTGFVNDLKFTKDGLTIVAAIGQEHRLGRWWTQKNAKNTVLVIPLLTKT